eukprot:gene8360-11312_t
MMNMNMYNVFMEYLQPNNSLILFLALGIILGIAFCQIYVIYIVPIILTMKKSRSGSPAKSSLLSQEDEILMSRRFEKVPSHIAIIMDGNRRFGKKTHGNPLQGHWVGGQTLVDFIQWCMKEDVKIITAYAFSTENWNRDPLEISTLMAIFEKYAESLKTEALAKNVKVNILSTDTSRLPQQVLVSIEELMKATSHCTGFIVNICLSYGSRGEIVNSCKTICEEVKNNRIKVEDIDEKLFSQHLSTVGLPEPDVLIRTSGEYRLSNFLLWQLAYTEMFFIDKFWPELTELDLKRIFLEYENRQRRYGT